MGEAFKRARARAFRHRRHDDYQRLVDGDLLTLARSTTVVREFSGRVAATGTELTPGADCLVRDAADGRYEVLHGNVVIAHLPQDAREMGESCTAAAPSLNGLLPCRIAKLGRFGAISFVVASGNHEND